MTYRRDAMARALSPHRVAAAEQEYASFADFCSRYGLAPGPDTVCVYLTSTSDPEEPDGKGARRTLARLDLAAHIRGEGPPSTDITVRKFLRGFHRSAPLGPRPERGEPLYAGDIRVLVDEVMTPTRRQIRDWAFLTLVNQSGLRSSVASRLTWHDLVLQRDGCLVHAELLHGRRRPIQVTVELARDENPLACPIQALTRLRATTSETRGSVFAYKADQAANKHLRSLLRQIDALSGINHPVGAPWTTSKRVAAVSARVLTPRAVAYRDRALLVLGFLAALTPSEAANLNVSDVRETHEGLLLHLPDRRYPTVALPSGVGERYCPVSAWRDWASLLRDLVPIGERFPAFPHCDYYQPIVQERRLTPGGLSKIIITTTSNAGLVGRYPFSSLRSGFVRSALRTGASHFDIARQVGYHYLAAVEAQQHREGLLSGNIAEVIGL